MNRPHLEGSGIYIKIFITEFVSETVISMQKYILPIIIILGFLLRIVLLDKIPAGFTPDEASFGYDAYSIIKTGRDQWGKTFPLVFESFGDYKSPLYTYLTIPSVWLFDLNKFSVRLPNAILGTAAIYVLYLLIKELKIGDSLGFRNSKLETLAPALLAASPWHIMMSRGAFEANLTTFLLPLSLLFFLKGLKCPKYLILSALPLSLNVFSYHSAKFVTPVLFIVLGLIFRKELLKSWGIWHKISIGILLLFAGIFIIGLSGGSSTRILDVSIFKTSLLEASSERIKAINGGMNPTLARVIYNKYQAGIRHFAGNYITYFSPQFYFSQGPAESTYGMIPGRGVLYWFELPILIIGFIYLAKNISSKFVMTVVFWLLLAPIPAALSIGPGYAANRAVIMLPALQIASALGLCYLIVWIDSIKYKKTVFATLGVMIFSFFSYFALDYFMLSPQKSAQGMLYGNYEALKYVSENYSGRQIIVSRRLSEPHMYTAFANKWDPADYQENSKHWNYKDMKLGWVDQMPEYRLGNYVFKNINLNDYVNRNVVLVGKPDEFPEGVSFDKLFLYPNGEGAIGIVDMNYQKYAWKN